MPLIEWETKKLPAIVDGSGGVKGEGMAPMCSSFRWGGDHYLGVGVVMDRDPNSSSQNIKALNKL
jgi:hypothetical protein